MRWSGGNQAIFFYDSKAKAAKATGLTQEEEEEVSPPETNIPPESIAPAPMPTTAAASSKAVLSKKQHLQMQTRTNWGKGENRIKKATSMMTILS
jgi:hypothetical protein